MKIIQHTLRESILVGLVAPFVVWGIVTLALAICSAFHIGQNPHAIREVLRPDCVAAYLTAGVLMGAIYASAIGSRVEIGSDRICIHRRNGDEESAELSAIQSWRYDSRQRRTLIRLNDGRELKLPRLAPIKVWILKSAVKAELAQIQAKADGAG